MAFILCHVHQLVSDKLRVVRTFLSYKNAVADCQPSGPLGDEAESLGSQSEVCFLWQRYLRHGQDSDIFRSRDAGTTGEFLPLWTKNSALLVAKYELLLDFRPCGSKGQ